MDRYKKFAPLFVVFGASLWGIDGIVLRPALFTLPVSLVVFIESAIVALVLTPLFYKKFSSFKLLQKGDWIALIGVAIFGGALGTMAITRALFFVNYVNLSIVILIQKLQPAFAIIFAMILLREKPEKKFYLWAGLAVLGAYFLTFGIQLPVISSGDKTAIAALFALIAAISFATSTVLSKRALQNIGHKEGTYLRFLITAIIMAIVIMFQKDIQSIREVSSDQWLIFWIIAFTSGGTAIFLYYFGLKEISASVATICELAFPLTAVVLEYILRGNVLDLAQWIGAFLLITSIMQVSRSNSGDK
jgi:drug/metabolite transporter (DMT)-like permease